MFFFAHVFLFFLSSKIKLLYSLMIVTDQDFREYFAKYGSILDSIVMIDRETKCSRGFGFVTFEDPAVANDVLEKNMKQQDSKSKVFIAGKWCEVKPSEPKRGHHGNNRPGGGRGRSFASPSTLGSEKLASKNLPVDVPLTVSTSTSPKDTKKEDSTDDFVSADDEVMQDGQVPGYTTDQYYYYDPHYHQQNPNAYYYPQYMPNNVSSASLPPPQMAYNPYYSYHPSHGAPPSAAMPSGQVFYNNQNAMMYAPPPTHTHFNYGNAYPQNMPTQVVADDQSNPSMLIQEDQHQVSNEM